MIVRSAGEGTTCCSDGDRQYGEYLHRSGEQFPTISCSLASSVKSRPGSDRSQSPEVVGERSCALG
jgi:hypothetical protein